MLQHRGRGGRNSTSRKRDSCLSKTQCFTGTFKKCDSFRVSTQENACTQNCINFRKPIEPKFLRLGNMGGFHCRSGTGQQNRERKPVSGHFTWATETTGTSSRKQSCWFKTKAQKREETKGALSPYTAPVRIYPQGSGQFAYYSEATQGMLRPPLVIPGAHHLVRDMMRGIWRGEWYWAQAPRTLARGGRGRAPHILPHRSPGGRDLRQPKQVWGETVSVAPSSWRLGTSAGLPQASLEATSIKRPEPTCKRLRV